MQSDGDDGELSPNGSGASIPTRERVAVLGIAASAITLALATALLSDREATGELLTLFPVAFSTAGTFLPLWGLSGDSRFGPYELGLFVWSLDTVKTLVVIYSFDWLYRLGAAGRFLQRQRAHASRLVAKRPRLRRASIGGLLLFVLLPIPGTGAIAGTLLGILVGMHRRAIITAASGASLLSALIVATIALHYGHASEWLIHAHTDPVYRFPIMGGVVIAATGGILLLRRRAAEPTRDQRRR